MHPHVPRTALLLLLLLLALIFVGGCAVDTGVHFDRVQELTGDRGESDLLWEQTAEDAALISEKITGLREGGIGRSEAATIAVLNSRELQAEYERLGFAAADLLQAGLPRNPVLDGAILAPVSAGDSGLGLIVWLSDLWMIPMRRDAARLHARTVELEVAGRVIKTAVDALMAWDVLVAARATLEVERAILETLRKRHVRTQLLFGHGLADTIAVARTEADHAEQEAIVAEAEAKAEQARAELDAGLSLDGAADDVRDDELPTPATAFANDPEQLIQTALDRRLAVLAARNAIEVAAAELGVQKALIWREVSAGAGYEGAFDQLGNDEGTVGPTFAIEIPIFDQNQAGLAAADHRIRQTEKQLAAVREETVAEAVSALHALRAADHTLGLVVGDLRAAVEQEHDYARSWNMKMQVSYLEVLDAQERRQRLALEEIAARIARNREALALRLAVEGP